MIIHNEQVDDHKCEWSILPQVKHISIQFRTKLDDILWFQDSLDAFPHHFSIDQGSIETTLPMSKTMYMSVVTEHRKSDFYLWSVNFMTLPCFEILACCKEIVLQRRTTWVGPSIRPTAWVFSVKRNTAVKLVAWSPVTILISFPQGIVFSSACCARYASAGKISWWPKSKYI